MLHFWYSIRHASPVCLVIAVIPHYNSGTTLLDSLATLVASDYTRLQLIVVDDASTDGLVNQVQARFPQVTVLRNSENRGFAYAANTGIAEALRRGAGYVFLLNNDATVAPSAVSHLVATVSGDPLAAAAMPTVYFHDRPQVIQSTGIRLDRNTGISQSLGELEVDRGQYAQVEARDSLHGCAMLIRPAAWLSVGPFWEPYFAYYEETDWCVRARDQGYRLLFAPAAKVWHRGGVSFDHRSPRYYYLCYRNQLYYIRRNSGRWNWRSDTSTLMGWYVRDVGHVVKKRRFASLVAICRAIVDFASGRTGPPT